MKKIAALLAAVITALAFCIIAAAEEAETLPSTPKIIVAGCENEALVQGKSAVLKITLKNTSYTASVKNLTASFSAEGGDILPQKTNTVYVSFLRRGGEYVWELPVTVKKAAPGGPVTAQVSCDYESEDGRGCTAFGGFTLELPPLPETTTGPVTEPPKKDASAPRLMVESYSLDGGSISPDEMRKLSIKIKNTSASKYVKNIKLTLSDESSELITEGTGTAFVKSIAPLGVYNWQLSISAAHSAATGGHELSLSVEYEDTDAVQYSAGDRLRLDVKQPSSLEVAGALLPVKCVQGETNTLTLSLMNTGKSRLFNCVAKLEAEGLVTGGAVLAGELAPGETGTAVINFRAADDVTGEVSGEITVTSEDEFGEISVQTFKVKTLVEKKAEPITQSTEEEKKYPLWWAFALGGFVLGAAGGAAVPVIIFSRRRRRLDEERL